MDKPFKINRGHNGNKVWVVIGMVVLAALFSLGAAALWQNFQQEDQLAPSQPAQPSSSISEPEPEPVSEPEPEPEPEPALPQIEGAVPESERVKSSYFDDAVFVGDSITTGIPLYQIMDNAEVLAGTGINLSSIYTEAVVKQEDGERITIMDGLKKKQFAKVYLLLGGNEVRDMPKDSFIQRYSSFLDDVRELQPDSIIYVQSITPVTAENNYNMDNNRINEYNEALVELCGEKKVYFVNIAEALKDDKGELPLEASPADGMHFNADYYRKWFEYLKTHTVS